MNGILPFVILLVSLAAIAVGLFLAVQRPGFVLGLLEALAKQLGAQAILAALAMWREILKPAKPEDLEKAHQAYRRAENGTVPLPDKRPGHKSIFGHIKGIDP